MKINMIGIITKQIDVMTKFYQEVLDMKIKLKLDEYIEFEHEGVRLALSTRKVMSKATGESSYLKEAQGHSFELAFKAGSPIEVDTTFSKITGKGAKAIKEPSDMPWGQRTAFFADPDGNIHEIFADLK
jgi:lactoylglutathione lyase